MTSNSKYDQDISTATIPENEDSDKKIISMCCFTSVICLILTYIAGLITWLVFAIIALVNNNNNDFNTKCQGSNLWIILLVWVILTAWPLIIAKKEYTKEDEDYKAPISSIVCSLLPSLAILGWTGSSLFNTCAINNFESNHIFLLLEVMFYFTSTIFVIMILLSLSVCIYGCCSIKKYNHNNLDNNLDNSINSPTNTV